MAKKSETEKNNINNLPMFCDYSCKYAEFSDPNATGACRKELAVWCTFLKKYNNKNNKCLAR